MYSCDKKEKFTLSENTDAGIIESFDEVLSCPIRRRSKRTCKRMHSLEIICRNSLFSEKIINDLVKKMCKKLGNSNQNEKVFGKHFGKKTINSLRKFYCETPKSE